MLLQIVIAAVLLCCSLLAFGLAMQLVLRMLVPLIRSGHHALGYWKGTAVMAVVTLIMAATHLIQIAIWAAALLLCGRLPDFETALYLSAQNYTAIGYGDIQLSQQWRLLGPLEAINGLVFFGVSTAVLFAILNQLIRLELRELGVDLSRTTNADSNNK